MALSGKARKEKLEVIHVMQDIFRDEMIGSPISESASESGDMKDLKEIEDFIEGKVPPYFGSKKSPTMGDNIELSLLFYSSKTTKVSEDNNFITIGFDPREDREDYPVSVRVDGNTHVDIGSFYGQAKKDESGDGTKLSDIMKLCNSDEIYNLYKKDALSIINRRLPTVYNLFTGGTVSHQMSKSIPTLCVAYYPRLNKFVYKYNPDFILKTALDEWFRTRGEGKYSSLRNCYCYILAFVISHEMMHLIHHNNTSTIDVGANYDEDSAADTYRMHGLSNIYTDSFINCRLSRAFKDIPEVRCNRGFAPVLSNGIGDTINVRAEHNNGFKSFDSTESLANSIVKVISDILKVEFKRGISLSDYSGVNISDFAGADVFIKLIVKSSYTPLRTNSGIFQRFVNEVLKVVTDGRVFSGIQISDAEKETDKEILPNGTLVQVKGSATICSVAGYDESSKKYTLDEMEIADTLKTDMGEGMIENIPIYAATGKVFGTRSRKEIRPFNPEDGAWIEQAGERSKKTKLDPIESPEMGGGSDESDQGHSEKGTDDSEDEPNDTSNSKEDNPKNIIDILVETLGRDATVTFVGACMDSSSETYAKSAETFVDECQGKTPSDCRNILGDWLYNTLTKLLDKSSDKDELESGTDDSEDEPNDTSNSKEDKPKKESPVFHVGDIVWVKRLKKYGRIISMDKGKFELEEMDEIGVRVLDDSEYVR